MNDDTRFYVSWTDGVPVLKSGPRGLSKEDALRHMLGAERARYQKAAELLERCRSSLAAAEALAAEHGIDPDAPVTNKHGDAKVGGRR